MCYVGRVSVTVYVSVAIYITNYQDTQLNRNVFSCLLKVSSMTSLDRSATGKLFHVTGPLTAKLLSP